MTDSTKSALAAVSDDDRVRPVSAGQVPVALEMYRTMRLIREVELAIESMHKRGRMTGRFTHRWGRRPAR